MGVPLELSAGPNSFGHRDRGRAEVQWESLWNSQPARTRSVTEIGAELRFSGSSTGTLSLPELGRSPRSGPSSGPVGVPLAWPNSQTIGHHEFEFGESFSMVPQQLPEVLSQALGLGKFFPSLWSISGPVSVPLAWWPS